MRVQILHDGPMGVSRIDLAMPNKHCLLLNLAPFGLENKNEVFVPTEEPFGLIEQQLGRAALFVVGARHCAQAIVRVAVDCGLFVQVVEDRADLLETLPAEVTRISTASAAEFIASRQWQPDEAIVIVSRNHELDRDALASAVRVSGVGYIR